MSENKKPNAEALKGKTGFRRLINATGYSMKGFKAAYQNEAAFHEETIAAAILIPVAFLLPVSWLESAILSASVLGVLLAEILNSALEAVVDRIGTEIHPLSGRAKDMGSAAVLIALIIAVIFWLVILIPYLIRWFF